MDLGFDGLMIESHCNPDKAWSDAAQQLTPDILDYVIDTLVIRDMKKESESLTTLRKQIDSTDNELLELLAKRMKISREIGIFKKEHNMQVLQTGRYDEIMQKRIIMGERLGMSADFIRKYLEAVHEESVRVQMEVIK
jgi:chorismate mutase